MHEHNQPRDGESRRTTVAIESTVGKFDAIKIGSEKQRADTPPVIMVGGWSTDETSYLASLGIIVEGGYTCWSPGKIDNPKKVTTTEEFQKLPQVELQKAMAIIGLIEQQHLPKVRLLCHSEGGLVGSMVGLLRPDLVQDLVLLAPIGLNGADSLPALLQRFREGMKLDQMSIQRTLGSIAEGIVPMVHDAQSVEVTGAYRASTPFEVQTLLNGASGTMRKHIMRSPINALREGLAMGQADIRPWLKRIRAEGVGVTVITHIDDKPIPNERVQESVPENWSEYLSGYYSMTGQHGDIMLHPGVYGKALQHVFHDLDNPIHRVSR